MEYKAIPRTDLNPSVICFGGGAVTYSDRRDFAFSQLDLYCHLGGNFIDTANIYGKWLPERTNISEQYIGQWLATRKNRNRIILATKGGHPDLASMSVPRLDRSSLSRDLEESLRALKTDTIDLYWLHRDDQDRPVEDILDSLQRFVREGKIRWYGCSNWTLPRILAARQAADREGWPGFVANQLFWSLADYNPAAMTDPTLTGMDDETWTMHKDSQMAAIPYSSQAGGYFQKLHTAGKAGIPQNRLALYDLPVNDRRYQMLLELSQQTGQTIDMLVLGYLLAQPFPVFPIIGPRTAAQLSASLKAGHRDWPAWLAGRLRDPGA